MRKNGNSVCACGCNRKFKKKSKNDIFYNFSCKKRYINNIKKLRKKEKERAGRKKYTINKNKYRTCKCGCGDKFVANSSNQLYKTDDCRRKARREKARRFRDSQEDQKYSEIDIKRIFSISERLENKIVRMFLSGKKRKEIKKKTKKSLKLIRGVLKVRLEVKDPIKINNWDKRCEWGKNKKRQCSNMFSPNNRWQIWCEDHRKKARRIEKENITYNIICIDQK